MVDYGPVVQYINLVKSYHRHPTYFCAEKLCTVYSTVWYGWFWLSFTWTFFLLYYTDNWKLEENLLQRTVQYYTLVLTVLEKDRVFFRTAQTVYSHTDYSTTTKCTVQYTIYTYRTAHGTVQWISNYCTVQYCKLADRTTALSKIIG